MKTAVYIEDGVEQIVLTAETRFEARALQALLTHVADGRQLSVLCGQFYETNGGWLRQSAFPTTAEFKPAPKDSVFLVLRDGEKVTEK